MHDFFPGGKSDVFITDDLKTLITGEEVKIGLSPFSIEIPPRQGHIPQLLIIFAGMDQYNGKPGAEILQGFTVKTMQSFFQVTLPGDEKIIHNDISFPDVQIHVITKPFSDFFPVKENRDLIFVSEFQTDVKKIWIYQAAKHV